MMISTAIRSGSLAALVGAAVVGFAGTANAAPTVAPGSPAMHGNPTAAAPYWRHQKYDDCALMATADVIGQLTGHEPAEGKVIKLAKSTPSQSHPGSIYMPPANKKDPNSGMGTDLDDIPVLLAHYGLHGDLTDEDHAAKTGIPTGIEALENDLDGGHKMIVAVNAELIWNQSGDQTRANHAVVVTGVDTAAGVVYLNDSGTPDGRDEQVNINTFMRAWQTSDEFMVVTEETR